MSDNAQPPVRVLLEPFNTEAQERVAHLPEKVIIASPYLTSTAAEAIIGAADPKTSTILTTFRAENFASGASSLTTLRELIGRGFNIRHLDSLHAKLIATSECCLIGSQNLTAGGTQNKEATAVISDPSLASNLSNRLGNWIRLSQPITLDMVEEMDAHLGPAIEKWKEFSDALPSIENQVRSAVTAREQERTRAEEQKQREQELEHLRKAAAAHSSLRAAVRASPVLGRVRLTMTELPRNWGQRLTKYTLLAPVGQDLTKMVRHRRRRRRSQKEISLSGHCAGHRKTWLARF